MEAVTIIIYKDILGKLKAAGYNTNRLRQEKLLPESTIQAIRSGKPITTKSIDTICALIGCKPGDILDYLPDNPDQEQQSFDVESNTKTVSKNPDDPDSGA